MDSYITEEVLVLEGDEAKALHNKNLVKAKKIIVDHLIPQVSSLKTPKEMFDFLTKLFEGKNINWKSKASCFKSFPPLFSEKEYIGNLTLKRPIFLSNKI